MTTAARRGRPPKETTLSSAERLRQYRKRKVAATIGPGRADAFTIAVLQEALDRAQDITRAKVQERDAAITQMHAAQDMVRELERTIERLNSLLAEKYEREP